jgi:2-polyprenyl-3-methyl-5-hydroxy-6-metoxy-1,4-benzoquinol methylase
MSDNPVRDVHDAVADSRSPAEASVRPPGTTSRQLKAMKRDVVRKLALQRELSVVEIGCGVGLLGVPVARRAARYVGLDFAPRAVQVANDQLRSAGRGNNARALCLDVLTVGRAELHALGSFDRVLMYAVFHYARTEQEATLFLQHTLDLLAPGGRALIGNVPLDDLQIDWAPPDTRQAGLVARVVAVFRWLMRPGAGTVPLTRIWKARRIVETTIGIRSSGEQFAPARLPPNYTLSLTTAAVERWLAKLDGDFVHHWELPAPGVPLAAGRADLIIVRR